MAEQPRRAPTELAAIALFSIASFALALTITVGLPALGVVRAWQNGLTVSGLLWGAFAALFVAALAYAIVRDRETRGWVAFLLLGWLNVFPLIARGLRRLATR
jgi:uncharacterized membrane protein